MGFHIPVTLYWDRALRSPFQILQPQPPRPSPPHLPPPPQSASVAAASLDAIMWITNCKEAVFKLFSAEGEAFDLDIVKKPWLPLDKIKAFVYIGYINWYQQQKHH